MNTPTTPTTDEPVRHQTEWRVTNAVTKQSHLCVTANNETPTVPTPGWADPVRTTTPITSP